MDGPLHGLKVIEMKGIGPTPFCGMMLSNMGAEVLRIERPGADASPPYLQDISQHGRASLPIDLGTTDGVATLLTLVEQADILIEGFRPGVMERLGVGPAKCHARNARLVYGRMTGWGQEGPLAQAAGHDINYLALTGVLQAIGNADRAPVPPLNLVGDFGGGAMFLLCGVLAAIHHARQTGEGQVVDAAMVDGAAMLANMIYGFKASGYWSDLRESNLVDGGAHFYATYACADGKYIAIGSIEPRFYRLLLSLAQVDDPAFDDQMNRAAWPVLKQRLAQVFASRTQAEWCRLMEGTDVCFAPVLDWNEAPGHPHNVARGTFLRDGDVVRPAPAPRFSRFPANAVAQPSSAKSARAEVLRKWRLDETAGAPAQGTSQPVG